MSCQSSHDDHQRYLLPAAQLAGHNSFLATLQNTIRAPNCFPPAVLCVTETVWLCPHFGTPSGRTDLDRITQISQSLWFGLQEGKFKFLSKAKDKLLWQENMFWRYRQLFLLKTKIVEIAMCYLNICRRQKYSNQPTVVTLGWLVLSFDPIMSTYFLRSLLPAQYPPTATVPTAIRKIITIL